MERRVPAAGGRILEAGGVHHQNAGRRVCRWCDGPLDSTQVKTNWTHWTLSEQYKKNNSNETATPLFTHIWRKNSFSMLKNLGFYES